MNTIGAGGQARIDETVIPKKMEAFDDFVQSLKAVLLQGTEKYSGATVDKKETIDIIPDVLGEEGYRLFILGDLLKRIFRIKNQNRERDIIKIAVWCYLYYARWFHGKNDEEK